METIDEIIIETQPAKYANSVHCPFLDRKCMGNQCVKWYQLLAPNPRSESERCKSSFGVCTVILIEKDPKDSPETDDK